MIAVVSKQPHHRSFTSATEEAVALHVCALLQKKTLGVIDVCRIILLRRLNYLPVQVHRIIIIYFILCIRSKKFSCPFDMS